MSMIALGLDQEANFFNFGKIIQLHVPVNSRESTEQQKGGLTFLSEMSCTEHSWNTFSSTKICLVLVQRLKIVGYAI